MKDVDPVKVRSEKPVTMATFEEMYNEDLPESFPQASRDALKVFKKTYPALFEDDHKWSLERHRKKFMDWLPQHLRSLKD